MLSLDILRRLKPSEVLGIFCDLVDELVITNGKNDNLSHALREVSNFMEVCAKKCK